MPGSLASALRWISSLLEREGIPRQVVGGLAARVHGADRDLVDIDLYVPDDALHRVADAADERVTRAPARHVDDHWDIRFMKLEHSGWTIELGGADSARVRDVRVGVWRPAAVEFAAGEIHPVEGVELPIMPLSRLAAYKRGLDRPVDRRDLEEIEASHGAPLDDPPPELPTLEAPGLTLRNLGPVDVDALFVLFGDHGLTRFWGHPALPDRDAAVQLLEDIRAGARSGQLLQWGIVPEGETAVVGTCSLADVDRRNRRCELGVALGRGHRGRGLAERAAAAALRHGFEELRLHRVIADVDPRNDPALRLVRRLGFTREGRLREHYRGESEWQDGVLFGLLEREWSAPVPDGD